MSVEDQNKRAGKPDEVDESLQNDPVVDGRIVVGRGTDRSEDEPEESPEHDAEVQSKERGER